LRLKGKYPRRNPLVGRLIRGDRLITINGHFRTVSDKGTKLMPSFGEV